MALTDSIETGRRAASRGATHLIYRAPSQTAADQLTALRQLVRQAGIPVLAHSRADLALAAGAAGLHLPEADIAVADARRLLGPAALIGRSAHGREAVSRAAADGADYVIFGPIFATPTHPGRPGLGLEILHEVARSVSIPVVAIGGLDGGRGAACIAAGAAGYAGVRLFQDST